VGDVVWGGGSGHIDEWGVGVGSTTTTTKSATTTLVPYYNNKEEKAEPIHNNKLLTTTTTTTTLFSSRTSTLYVPHRVWKTPDSSVFSIEMKNKL